jgi:hypothetical protein
MGPLSPRQIWAARAIAFAADCLEIAIFPAFAEGFLSPANDALDVLVALLLTAIVGWHWAFLPTFLAEMVPMVSLVPTWTAAVFIATGIGPAQEPLGPDGTSRAIEPSRAADPPAKPPTT